MTRTAKAPAAEQAESADLMVMATVNPLALFTDREQFSQFYKRVKEETDKHVADVSTQKGRDAVRSLARKVITAKTTLEKAGKGLVEEMRQQVNSITSVRIQMVDEMDALAKEVRRPLTEWEEAEKARVERCRAVITGLQDAAVVTLEDTAATVRQRGKDVWGVEIGDEFGDMAEEARAAKATTVATLQRALERLTKEEADRAELERLRTANAEREAREAEKAAAEEAERVAKAAEEAEAQRAKDAAEAEGRRIANAAEAAAQAARDEADRKAREAEETARAEHEAALAEQKRRADEAEAREQKRLADEKAAADALKAREEDRAHRTRIQTAAKVAIMSCGADEDVARKIVLAIIAGEIPAVTLAW